MTDYCKQKWDKKGKYKYAIWGIVPPATELISYIEENYPNAELVAVIDHSKSKMYKGKIPIRIEQLSDPLNTFVFVSANAAVACAQKYFESIGKSKDTYVLYDEAQVLKSTSIQ